MIAPKSSSLLNVSIALPGFKVVALPSAATGAVGDREKRTTPNATRYKQAERCR